MPIYTIGKIEFSENNLLTEAATLLERYLNWYTLSEKARPTDKEVNELLRRIYAASEGR